MIIGFYYLEHFFSYFPILELLISNQINFYLGFYYLVCFYIFLFSVISYKWNALIVMEDYWIKNKKKHEVLLFLLVLQKLWTYQGFFLMAFKFYTFSLWFSYNHWVEVCYLQTLGQGLYQNLNFSFLGQIFQYYLLGLKVC